MKVPTHQQIYSAIRKLGARGALFQYQEIRTQLDVVAANRPGSGRIHNVFKALARDGVIEVAESNRKRNKYWKISDEDALSTLVSRRPRVARETATAGAGPAADRLGRIEHELEALRELAEQRFAVVEDRLGELLDIWA